MKPWVSQSFVIPDRNPPGMLRRLAALLYDTVVLAAVLFAATVILLPFHNGEAFQPNHGLYSAYLLTVSFAFFGWFWTHGGQTLGMCAWKIRLRTTAGAPVSWGQAAIRLICGLISFGCLGLGYLWILFDSEGRSWHDLVSRSKIVWQD
ncbi:RDD family protein [Methylocaldum sp.]|uniref:RDD family protein n=1 Tax=Methylocaldum sp. TaxID=1969727 RepID=UPI002D397050|nr:RDD family protein [Methylocaldum sp.]HYE35151.1 RDD family protein [Methylocaldum sp.]